MDHEEETRRRSPGDSPSHQPGGLEGALVKNRYRISKQLGRGGFATTYLAVDTQLDSRPVVIKILLESHDGDPWVLKKFRQEMQALSRLNHPGVVAALDWGELADGKPFLVMQFIEGLRLRDAMTPRGMDLHRAAGILRQLGQALTASHEAGICHRDVKPENILLQRLGEDEEQAKLIDFGIATIRDSKASTSSQSSKIVGSLEYMAPEQFEGKSSPASDVFALGVVAYELVTGRHPFCPESPAEMLRMHEEGVRVKPKELRPRLSETAQECILKALSKDAARRYQRARDFGEALAPALVEDESAPPEGPGQPRRLEIAHVLFMDLVGYSTLATDQQTEHLSRLLKLVRATSEYRNAQKGDDLISLPTGDGMALVFFGDPTVPARCALSVATALQRQSELQLRMGLHTGPVYRVMDINTDVNVAGGGINIAQRVMDCGDAGHILLSRSFAEVLGQLSDWTPHLRDLGEHTVKHGARLHLYNLAAGVLGNPNVPTKLRAPEAAAPAPPPARHLPSYRGALSLAALVLAAATAFLAYRIWIRKPTTEVTTATPGKTVTPPPPQPSSQAAPQAAQPNVKPKTGSEGPSVTRTTGGAGVERRLSGRVNPRDGQRYIWIPPGRFQMGCSPSDNECSNNERPAHHVEITRGFWLGQTEVTQAAYQKVRGTNPSFFPTPDRPVEQISWLEAGDFCQSIGGRLPTEAEWEYAARAGSTLPRWGALDRIAWHAGNSGQQTHPVAQRQPNPWELYDMLGNVGEWVADWSGDYVRGETRDPAGAAQGRNRVVRGASWQATSSALRTSFRNSFEPSMRRNTWGCRCIWDPDSATGPGQQAQGGPSPPEPARVNPKDEQKYVWIPPGRFRMGCSPGDNECLNEEKPAHDVKITRGFWLGESEVTQAAYQKVTGKNPSTVRRPDFPVVQVTWGEAREYCEGVGGRLPTEAEWEYAARAGSGGARYGPVDRIAWYDANSDRRIHPVRQKEPNTWMLYDMLGNVAEWVADWYGPAYYRPEEVTDPAGPGEGQGRAVRGGSAGFGPQNARASLRFGRSLDFRGSVGGFRCAWN